MPRNLGLDAVQAVRDACEDSRERLLVTLMVDEGLRRCECARLQVADVLVDEGQVRIVGKGGHVRLLPVVERTDKALRSYLGEVGWQAGPLIRSTRVHGAGILPARVGTIVKAVVRRAGVDATPHQLRHTMAAGMVRRGASLRQVQQALGHASLMTTQIYLPFESADGLREVME